MIRWLLDLVVGLVVVCLSSAALACVHSSTARAKFVKANPCQLTTQHKRTACPGYVVDHVVPLCAGGKDHPSNMQWQRYRPDSLDKDKVERAQCKAMKRALAYDSLGAEW